MTTIADLLKKIEELDKAATPQPWRILEENQYLTPSKVIWSPKKHAWDQDDQEYNSVCEFTRSCEYGYGSDAHIENDAKFIAEARRLLPLLAEIVREYAGALTEIEIDGINMGPDDLWASIPSRISQARTRVDQLVRRMK